MTSSLGHEETPAHEYPRSEVAFNFILPGRRLYRSEVLRNQRDAETFRVRDVGPAPVSHESLQGSPELHFIDSFKIGEMKIWQLLHFLMYMTVRQFLIVVRDLFLIIMKVPNSEEWGIDRGVDRQESRHDGTLAALDVTPELTNVVVDPAGNFDLAKLSYSTTAEEDSTPKTRRIWDIEQ